MDCKALLLLALLVALCDAHNKYSAKANDQYKDPKPAKEAKPSKNAPGSMFEEQSEFRKLEKPFRMAKLNMLWSKAQLRLTEPKLKSLFSELKIHDKEELTFKKLKSDGKDKDGMMEATMRKKLIGIMSSYDLLEHFDDINDPAKHRLHKPFNQGTGEHINKSLFKDKKLNKLWEKAEHAGFSAEELQALREEFQHHQEKLDQFYALLEDVEKRTPEDDAENSVDETHDKFNTIASEEEDSKKDVTAKANLLRTHHRDIKDSYDRLNRIASKGPKSQDFVEPKVQGLWRMAVESNFSPDELASLKTELLHYENRLLKLRHLQAEAVLGQERYGDKKLTGQKTDGAELMEDTIKKHARKVDKMHDYLEKRITAKHSEL
ncbi:Alpha-2-macroglobulin receptor-associated protein [Frankliniella fusca]|uniref:Alpha-2-macroglobulin receptor-associated protein n=1 Tax=Frankliniella fusca TaxID=407009 RepID=A0AAE1HAX8_9NEOP|nr:Alpha-2-macroglobulin receptor-associated protein [Frankliniella fusca]